MSRLLFFLLLIAVLAVGAHLWLSGQAEIADFSLREKNRDDIKLVAVTPPTVAARRNEETRKAMQSLVGAACVEFSGVAPADATRAHDAFAAMQLGDRLVERRVEEITRHWVFMPPAPDRRTADATVADLKRRGVNDVSLRPDLSVSLGVFSTEEAARRFLASLDGKGVRGAQEGPFAKELREMVMVVREPDSELVSRLTLLQRDYTGSQLRAVPCPTT